MTVRTRFAPSPTGYLHIGGVRTALFNWLFARQHGGQFLLRIDDTDAERNVAEALQPILDGFKWLGLDWDEGPTDDGTSSRGPCGSYFQSQRLDRYQAAVKEMLAKGLAYRDFATTDELKAEREQAEKEKKAFLYSRRWMAETDDEAAKFAAEGRTQVVRCKMPRQGKCVFTDRIRGVCEFDWDKEQDHVIQRADGTCLYHLASVVDDQDFRISHVIRAVEHLSNTPRQIFIAEALGYPLPEYAHLPYVAEPGSHQKLSKRKIAQYLKNPEFKRMYDQGAEIAARIGRVATAETFNPVIVDFYRDVGYLPDAIINYLVLLGWSLDDKTEDLTREEMIQHFSLERVTNAPASFDPKKLWSFEDRAMQRVPTKQKVPAMLRFLQAAKLIPDPAPCEVGPKLTQIIEASGDRLKVAGDILAYADFFFLADAELPYDAADFAKRVAPPQAKELLGKFRAVLATVEPFEVSPLEEALKSFIAAQGIKIGDIVHTLRVAVTGKSVGPGVYDCLAILGRESSLARIDRALAK
ncbi:MAG: glutamate--tRNA ligase [Pirellulaceae bacterium]|nr:glutamate--tRNA ligase [Pirellulaceae bacterium]